MILSRKSKLQQFAVASIAAFAIATPTYSAPADSSVAASSTSSMSAPDISGTYICTGVDNTDRNSQYTVELTVTKSGDGYSYKGLEKGIDNKSQTYLGTGLFAQNSTTTIGSIFWQENDPSKSGVVIHQIQPDGTWKGIWTWRDKVGINTETCQKK
jgi:hypothetical protein